VKLYWNLTDLRAWWESAARKRWIRAMRLSHPRDLTNFGDVI
jgi:hypothetical protein